MNPVLTYLDRYKRSGLTAAKFAVHALARWPDLCLTVLEHIGSWPSSEPELAALQRAYR